MDMYIFKITILFNDDETFEGVELNGKQYTLDEWNNLFSELDPQSNEVHTSTITPREQLKLKIKNFTRMLPLLALMLLSGCGTVRIENYYLAYGFEGNVAIIYNNKKNNGKIADVFNYDVPITGILYSQTSFPEGNFIVNYFQKRKSGGLDTLFVKEPSIKLDSLKSFIVFPRILSFAKEGKVPIIVTSFYVGKKDSKDLANDRIDFERNLEKKLFKEN